MSTSTQSSSKSKVTTKEDIHSIKEEASKAFQADNFYKAIMLYEEGVRRCTAYNEVWGAPGSMPYRCEFGESPVLEEGSMYY